VIVPASGQAMVVTIGLPTASFPPPSGSTLGTGSSVQVSSNNSTLFQIDGPGIPLTVPAAGVITLWRVAGQGGLALRVLRPTAGGLLAVSTSPSTAGLITNAAPASFPTHIPVIAGDQIGVDLTGLSPHQPILRATNQAGAHYGQLQGVPLDNTVVAPGLQVNQGALGLNADVTLAPVATGIDVASGSAAGGTAVTISGTYLDGVTNVRFGTTPVPFTLNAAGGLVVSTPPAAAVGKVDVQVAGDGGVSTLTGAFTYTAPPPVAAKPPVTGPTTAPSILTTTSRPLITNLALAPSFFLAAHSGASLAAAFPSGTHVSYEDSAAATTRFEIVQLVPGRMVPSSGGGLYCRPVVNPVFSGPHCTRAVTLAGAFSHNDKAGANALRFTGRLGNHTLPPGAYRLLAQATDAAGNRSKIATHAFRILPAAPRPRCPTAHAARRPAGC